MNDYKHTLNLPATQFSMKANLARLEPEILAFWNEINAAKAMTDASGSKGSFILHDGPPYANGHIHMGTALNKILKDMIVKSRNMQGESCEYVPGWDCHGLPIEHKVEQEASGKNLSPLQIRKQCRAYAEKWIDIQRNEFIRLGVLGEWHNPYLSMRPEYEAKTALNLAQFVENGDIYRARKPIYWCCSCHTALAEAEVEYADEKSPSIYAAFPIKDSRLKTVFPNASDLPAYIAIWTTTPWTLPSNQGVCLNPDYSYVLVQAKEAQYLLAAGLLENCAKLFGWENFKILGEAKGAALEGIMARHPFYDRESKIILGAHVTLESGTGCVHTAPGHGREDFEAGLKYNLEVLSPLNDAGEFLPNVQFFAGQKVWQANASIIEKLRENGTLLASKTISHSYPHCWRCKKPVIFHATTQWFISMEANGLRKRSLEDINRKIKWIPAWGRDRIYNMIEARPDWCISRQRQWGVPIIALKCKNCGQIWNNPQWMRDICSKFANHSTGCDYWYEAPLSEIVPDGLKCQDCGKSDWQKETDILDVWFDSGTSFSAVLESRSNLGFPADLYLEGSDQHRGWFHSSLLIAEGTKKTPPYKSVLTHGYVVDGEGCKMSKSVGNVIAPEQVINKYGAEIIRLWAASVDYQEDIRISDEILDRLVDAYRRIRNTCRFILGNLSGFDKKNILKAGEMLPLDQFAVDTALQLFLQWQKAYAAYEFHKIFHGLHNYCVTGLSAFYLDIIKDRLYVSAPYSKERLSAQTALLHILLLLLRNMAPIFSFTSEEIFRLLPETLKEQKTTVFALQPPNMDEFILPLAAREAWNYVLSLRSLVTRAQEPLRKEGKIGHSLDTKIILYLEDDKKELLKNLKADLRETFIVSQIAIEPLSNAPKESFADNDLPSCAVMVENAKGDKCSRCWIYSEELGKNAEYPDICPRCAKVMETLKKA